MIKNLIRLIREKNGELLITLYGSILKIRNSTGSVRFVFNIGTARSG